MRLLKYFFITSILLILLSVIILLLLITFINPNNFKPTISAQVQKLTGRTLIMNGNLKWSFFPWLGIEVNDASLSNPKGFESESFAKLKTVDFYIKVLPLLKKNIKIGQILIKDANINLIVKANGENNWHDLIKTGNTSQKKDASKEPTQQDYNFNISVDKLIINNATVKYSDLQNKQYYTIEHFNLQLNDIKLNQAFPLMANFAFNYNQELHSNINLYSHVKFTQDNLALTNLKLEGKLQGKQLPSTVNMHLTANSDLNLASEALTISGLTIQLANLKAKADLRGEKVLSNARVINGNITVDPFNLHDFLKNLGQTYSNSKSITSANTKIKLSTNNLALNNLTMQLDNNKLAGNVNWNLTTKQTQLNMTATDMKVGEFINPMLGNSKFQLSGTGNLDAHLNTTSNALIKNLTGQVKFAIHNGALEGIDIKHQFETAYALIKKQSEPPALDSNRTSFGTLTGTIDLVNGVAKNNDLLLQASDLKLTGIGMIDLNTQQIDYQLKAILTAQNLDPKTKEIQQYIGGSLPIRISGTFHSFRVYPDVNAIAEEAAKSFINKHTEKLQEKVGEEVNKQLEKVGGEMLKQNLQNLFH